MTNKKIATLGLFCSLAIIFGYVEAMIPFFAGIPGMKLGLANLAVLFVLERYSVLEALIVSVIRIMVIGFLFGNLFGIAYSTAGALLSITVMTVLLKKCHASIMAVSMAGGISHNIGQLLIAIWLVENANLLYYGPALIVSGIVTGLLIGILTSETLKRIR